MNRRILYAQYANPGVYPPLQHSARILADAGWDVLVLGIQDAGTLSLDFPKHARIRVERLSLVEPGWRRVFYFLYFLLWVVGWSRRFKPQWVYASDLYATPAAWLLSFGTRVVYHEHDTPEASRTVARICMTARAWLAHRATLCVFPNAKRAARFADAFQVGEKTVTVWNCPERAKVLEEHGAAKRTREEFRVLYHGSIVPSRLPLTVIDALVLLPANACLRIVGYETVGSAGHVAKLLERARELGVAERVEWCGQVATRAELLALARECDVGLALMPNASADVNEQTMAGASNKPFDYMACGLGVVVTDLPDWRALFVDSGFARACNPADAASLGAAIKWYWDHPTERIEQGRRAQIQILNEWNYQAQFAPVIHWLIA